MVQPSKRPFTRKGYVDDAYAKVCGRWMYPRHRQPGRCVEFFVSEHRDLLASKRFIRKASARHGRPERIANGEQLGELNFTERNFVQSN